MDSRTRQEMLNLVDDNKLRRLLACTDSKRQKFHTPKRFNLFTVLHKESDEVNLHSKFLYALLNQSGEQNLVNFLKHVGIKNFSCFNLKVEREKYINLRITNGDKKAIKIDLLITNGDKQAIIIENKIYAVDQPQQLYRYYKELEKRNYRDIQLIYLTLNGHRPSDSSTNGLNESERELIKKISYECEILKWLEICLGNADESALQSAITQYIELVNKLTKEFKYMSELENLLLKDNNLCVLEELKQRVGDLEKAETKIKDDFFKKLWREIHGSIEKRIPQLELAEHDGAMEWALNPNNKSNDDIKLGKFKTCGLYYSLKNDNATLGVEMFDQGYIIIGVRCNKSHCQHYEDYREKLIFRQKLRKNEDTPENPDWWAWLECIDEKKLNFRKNEVVIKLLNDKNRKNYVDKISENVKQIWEILDKAELTASYS